MPKVKNLRFEFSDGSYSLKWDEERDTDVDLQRELSLTINERKPFVGGNWKSNGLSTDLEFFIHSCLNNISFDPKKMEVVVAPTALHIAMVNNHLVNSIQVSAQNVSKFGNGAYTSQISADILKDMDCNWTIIGHSERRHVMHETDMDIGMKAKSALDAGLKVILCVGETLIEHD